MKNPLELEELPFAIIGGETPEICFKSLTTFSFGA